MPPSESRLPVSGDAAPRAMRELPLADEAATRRLAEDVVPQTFDPTQSSQIRTWYMWQLVYEGLVRADMSGKIVPVLASRWTVDAWAPIEGRVINAGFRVGF